MTLIDKSLFKPTPTFRARRMRVMVRVQVEGTCGNAQDAMVRDISPAGMSAVARISAPAVDDVVSVMLPDCTRLWGIVRWTEGKAFGVEFDPSSRELPAAAALGAAPPVRR